MLADKELAFSGKRTLDYQNKSAEICVYFQKNLFEPGKYTVDIFADESLIGESSIVFE